MWNARALQQAARVGGEDAGPSVSSGNASAQLSVLKLFRVLLALLVIISYINIHQLQSSEFDTWKREREWARLSRRVTPAMLPLSREAPGSLRGRSLPGLTTPTWSNASRNSGVTVLPSRTAGGAGAAFVLWDASAPCHGPTPLGLSW